METLVIGIDGGEWDIIDPLISKGKLPNIEKLKRDGMSGSIESTTPPVSPPAWTSIQTGTNPGKHGIYDFSTFDKAYNRRSVNSTDRRAKPFWELMNDQDVSTGLFKIPFTYPPNTISGYMVTGFPTPNSVEDFIIPESLAEEVGPVEKLFEDGAIKNEGDLEGFKQNLISVAERQTDKFLGLLEDCDTDFAMTVYDGSDRAQHFFWRYSDKSHPRYEYNDSLEKAIEDYYKVVDEGIGKISEAVEEDCDIIILSDHGFGPLTHDIYIDEWLEEERFLTRKSSFSTAQIKTNILGTTLWTIWKGIKKANLEDTVKSVLPEFIFDTGKSIKRGMNDTHADVVWDETDVFFTTLSGQSLCVNLETKFDKGTVPKSQYTDTVNKLRESLLSLKNPETNESLIEEVWTKKELFDGWAINDAPDIIVRTDPRYTLKGGHSDTLLQPSTQDNIARSGDHRTKGIFIASGPSFDQGRIQEASVLDVAPTLLHLHRCSIPEYMDGTVLQDVFSDLALQERELKYTKEYNEINQDSRSWTSEEQADLQSQLEELGYLG